MQELLPQTEAGNLNWRISPELNTLISTGPGFIAVVSRIRNQGCGRTIGCHDEGYTLTFFTEAGGCVVKSDHYCPSRYDSSWPELPAMDLYDIITAGEKRRRRPAHCCGASGFGAMGDICPACEDEAAQRVKPQDFDGY
jgi:hypothetical protein